MKIDAALAGRHFPSIRHWLFSHNNQTIATGLRSTPIGGNLDLHLVVLLQGEIVGRNDAGAGQQHGAMNETSANGKDTTPARRMTA